MLEVPEFTPITNTSVSYWWPTQMPRTPILKKVLLQEKKKCYVRLSCHCDFTKITRFSSLQQTYSHSSDSNVIIWQQFSKWSKTPLQQFTLMIRAKRKIYWINSALVKLPYCQVISLRLSKRYHLLCGNNIRRISAHTITPCIFLFAQLVVPRARVRLSSRFSPGPLRLYLSRLVCFRLCRGPTPPTKFISFHRDAPLKDGLTKECLIYYAY